MTASAFDTHEAVGNLKKAGASEALARTIVDTAVRASSGLVAEADSALAGGDPRNEIAGTGIGEVGDRPASNGDEARERLDRSFAPLKADIAGLKADIAGLKAAIKSLTVTTAVSVYSAAGLVIAAVFPMRRAAGG